MLFSIYQVKVMDRLIGGIEIVDVAGVVEEYTDMSGRVWEIGEGAIPFTSRQFKSWTGRFDCRLNGKDDFYCY